MLDVTTEWWWALIIAGVSGATGGVVYELLLDRGGETGLLERFSRQDARAPATRAYYDLGFIAWILVGAVAAMGFLYFLTPELRTVTDGDGVSVTTRWYDPFKLVAASLIVGTGGAAFINAMQQRVLAVVSNNNLQTLTRAVQEEKGKADTLIGDALDAAKPSVSEGNALLELRTTMSTLSTVAEQMQRR